jgi:hypothetical protein
MSVVMDCLDCYLPAARPKALLSCSSMNDAATPERNVLALRELANNAASALQIAGFEPTCIRANTMQKSDQQRSAILITRLRRMKSR